ncbi:hypothetical protein Tco_0523289 [Tanacetum coccineum]
METRKWSEDDKRRSKDFITAIEKRLQIRRIYRSLESFVGGRIRDINYRADQKNKRDDIVVYSIRTHIQFFLSFSHCGNKSYLVGIQEHLLGVPIQEELTALRFRADIAEAENASLRARIKTTEAIGKITRNRERQARVKIEQQLAAVQESQRQDREDFRKLKELMTSQFGRHS